MANARAAFIIPRMTGEAFDDAAEKRARRSAPRRNTNLIAALCALSVAGVVLAIDDVHVTIEQVDGAGWNAQGLTLSMDLKRAAPGARIDIARLHVPALAQELRNVHIDCDSVDISPDAFTCRQALIAMNWPGLGEQSMSARIRYGRRDGALDVAISGVRLAQGSGGAKVSLQERGWRASVDLKEAPVELLLKLAREFAGPAVSLSANSGLVSLTAVVRGSGAMLERTSIDAKVTGLNANNESGSLAAEQFSFDLKGEVQRLGQLWRFSVDVGSHQGQAYAQPIFLDLGVHALAFNASGLVDHAQRVVVEKFSLDHAGVAQARGAP